MPKRTSAASVAAAAVLLLALTGCAGGVETPSADRTAPAATSPKETAAPLVAETPAAAPSEDVDAAFVAAVRASLPPTTQIPNATDQQLIDAGHQACERLAAGEASDQMSVIEGEVAGEGGYYWDSAAIINAARTSLCLG